MQSPEDRLHVRADGDDVGWSIVTALVAEFPNAARWRMPAGTRQYEEEISPSCSSTSILHRHLPDPRSRDSRARVGHQQAPSKTTSRRGG